MAQHVGFDCEENMEKEGGKISAALRAHFPGQRLSARDAKVAGRKLKLNGEAAMLGFLRERVRNDDPPDFQAPAKCSVVHWSRPFSAWPIYQVAIAIQTYINSRSVSEMEGVTPKTLTSSQSHKVWFAASGVSNYGYTHVQGLNKIFANAIGRFQGVLTKAKNRAEKKAARLERTNERRRQNGLPDLLPDDEKMVVDSAGYLLEPPGLNYAIYGYQGAPLAPWTPLLGVPLPEGYEGYERDPHAPIPVMGDRLDIPKGSPGYVPEWQRPLLSTRKHHRRMRAYWKTPQDKAKEALLVVWRIGADFAIFDVRGLLRAARWRGAATKDTSLVDLMTFFTGDPVISRQEDKWVATFMFKPEVVGVASRKLLKGKASRKLLLKETTPREGKVNEVAVVPVDLGSTNPVAAAVEKVSQREGELERCRLDSIKLPDNLLTQLDHHKRAHDILEEQIRRSAIDALPLALQEEVLTYDREVGSAGHTKQLLCSKFDLNQEALPWHIMTSSTTYISDALLSAGVDRSQVYFTPAPKKGKSKPSEVKRRDRGWAQLMRPRLAEGTRKALQEAEWEVKRTHPGYRKLSKSKQQLGRTCRNYVIEQAKWRSQCETIIVIIEDLTMSNRMFMGSGSRQPGWDNFFVVKKEGRWYMQTLHRAFSELPVHRGVHVVEVSARYTSQTCPSCGHCDRANRDDFDRERFECRRCGRRAHTDFDVATANIATVAVTGKPLPGPCERSGDALDPAPARAAE